MSLVPLCSEKDGYSIDLKYATSDNVTGQKIYENGHAYIHTDASILLTEAQRLAKALGYTFKIFDVYRPAAAQNVLWDFCPDANFITPPEIGSPHTRGVAVDLTLIDETGLELDMGTPFDDFTEKSHHKNTSISLEAQKNRFLLCGLMTLAGWEYNPNEWWHYHLPNYESYPLINDIEADRKIMA